MVVNVCEEPTYKGGVGDPGPSRRREGRSKGSCTQGEECQVKGQRRGKESYEGDKVDSRPKK